MQQEVRKLQQAIDLALAGHLPQCGSPRARPLDDALRYAVFPGGKRIRPLLCLLGARLFGMDTQDALPAACAVEFIHTSSLLFDDLPCMDDAQIRRGIPVVHRVFGEEVAVLAGLALLNQGYAIFGQTPSLIVEAAACIGVDGMIGGQALDLVPDNHADGHLTERREHLKERNRKTSAMMRLAVTAGALACGVPQSDVGVLGRVGQSLGEAFQMGDDVVDARRSSQHTGKSAGQDLRHNRPSNGSLNESACVAQLNGMVTEARMVLSEAYGRDRTAELASFVEAMFAGLMAGEETAMVEHGELSRADAQAL